MTVSLYAEFTATAGNEPAVYQLITDFASAVRAEPGNLRFDPHFRDDNPMTIFVYEQYSDQTAFDSHLASAHGIAFNTELAPLVSGGGSTLTMLKTIGETNDNF
ncbi:MULTISPECIES: putative quinol monooxygenase [Subtercola]|uniref:Antibiotic biosynthesis monooxygenase n=1 Tax=Subtercola vilae TaxID=2056433 RepID=A0A4T2BU71_9MICO|nr:MULTISPECIES: putative quinol monooxygenase [Subtercola]MEA9984666.1 putative quinol monooxygenase [Subtercola sp. RTI3]TIH35293.1 antibiotic biosynthesis monooxygenase [Subtercola vilae]